MAKSQPIIVLDVIREYKIMNDKNRKAMWAKYIKDSPRTIKLQKQVDSFSPIQKENFRNKIILVTKKGYDVKQQKMMLEHLGFSKHDVNDSVSNAKLHGVFFNSRGIRIR